MTSELPSEILICPTCLKADAAVAGTCRHIGIDVEMVRVVPIAEARAVIEALSGAVEAALEAVEAHVQGRGPRGAELLPLLTQVNEAADARDALLERCS